jgi:hypothetical protein
MSGAQAAVHCLALLALTAMAGGEEAKTRSPGAAVADDPLQLFLDDREIESQRDVRFVLHSPRPAEVVIRRDKPWEDSTMYDPVVMKDGDRYRMWYRANLNSPPYYTAYAESKDGIRWTKLSLGVVEYRGSKDNNIVWAGDHSKNNGKPTVWCVFKDENPKAPMEERYKATGLAAGDGLQGLVSPDGIRWRLLQTEKVVPAVGPFDTHSISMWDAARGKYVVYTREFVKGVRQIRRTESDDFRKFPVPTLIKFLDKPARPLEHLYKNAATAYFRRPQVMLMFPKRFLPDRTPDPKWPAPGLSDVVFMFSYDGVHFDRRYREAFIRPGHDPQNWHERAIEVGPGVVPTGPGEMSLYYMEHYRTDSVRIRRGVLRIDGLVSVQAGAGGGEIVTRPMSFAGNRLVMNFSTSAAGSVRVELQAADGTPLKGFGLRDSPEIYGDAIEQVVRWKTGSDLTPLAGRPVRVRLVVQDADLYSFRFVTQ